MTPKKFLAYLFLQWAMLALLKIVYFNNHLLQSEVGFYLYLILTAAIAAAIVRRQGFINYLEAGAVSIAWLVLGLFLDYIVTNQFLPVLAFSHLQAWAAYGILLLTIFFFVRIGNAGLVLGFIGLLVLFLLIDAVFGSKLETTHLSFQIPVWTGYVVMILSVIIFHKKRHVAIRRGEHTEHGHH